MTWWLRLVLAQFDPSNLPTNRLRQRLNEFYLAWVLVRCRHTLAVLLQLARQRIRRRVTLGQHDKRLHNLPAHLVRFADHCGFDYGFVLDERAFDFERSDAISRALDHVIGAADERVRSVL